MSRNIFEEISKLTKLEECDSGDENVSDDQTDDEINDSEIYTSSDCDEEIEELETLVSKNSIRWYISKSIENMPPGRSCARNVFIATPGPSATAKRVISNDERPLSAFSLLIDEGTLRKIQKYTIAEANRIGLDEWTLTLDELEKFMGLLYARGLLGSKNIPINDLWSANWGNDIFRRTMSRDRFIEIMKHIRFDNKTNRSSRLQQCKFALFSEIWNAFTHNCEQHYIPNENLTVDEQLFPTKSRCRFTQYMGNKPDKFGIKFWIIADVETKYFLGGFPYLGKDESRDYNTLAHHVVLKLANPYLNKGYNITGDNYFTHLSLVLDLMVKRTTYVGTVRSNRRELPQAALNVKNKPMFLSSFYKETNGVLLTSYKVKSTKNVLIMSSRHSFGTVSDGLKQKPNSVLFYNATKCGVDTLDQMCKGYSVKSGVRRWPLACFFNVMDLAGINAYILYKKVTGIKITRRAFMKILIEDLTKSNGAQEATVASNVERGVKRRKCSICTVNKTRDLCSACSKLTCGKCTASRELQIKCNNCC